MKKKLLNLKILLLSLVAAGIFFSGALFAQETNGGNNGKISLGLEITPQFTKISNTNYVDCSSKVRPYTGIFILYDVNQVLKFKTGLFFDMRSYGIYLKTSGLKLSDSTGYTGYNSYLEFDFTNTVNYITVPVDFFYQKGDGKLKVFVEGGLYFSLTINNNSKGDGDMYIHPDDLDGFNDSTLTAGHHYKHFDSSNDNFFNTYDLGVNLGMGISYYFKPELALQFSPGFSYGLTNVFEDPETSSKWSNIFKLHLAMVYKLK
jgi:hypothetical protein